MKKIALILFVIWLALVSIATAYDGDALLLEDGSGAILLEDGSGVLLLEDITSVTGDTFYEPIFNSNIFNSTIFNSVWRP